MIRLKGTKESRQLYAVWDPGSASGTEKHASEKTGEIWMKFVINIVTMLIS